ncbi:MAG: phosphate uptake regulator PhoU [Sulfurospirillaceae bacterium]|nr:phosphate uptake regulator PhoU [Sulfurospirillaceae bacterium]
MLQKYEKGLSEIKVLLQNASEDISTASKYVVDAIENLDKERLNEARNAVKNIEKKANKIDQEIIKTLALYGPEATQLRELVAYLKITNELVRISDQIRSFCKKMSAHLDTNVDFSTLFEYTLHLAKSSTNAVQYAMSALNMESEEEIETIYSKVHVEESKSDDLYTLIEKNILIEASKSIEQSADFIHILSTMRKLERTADRAVNIAKLALFAKIGGEVDFY